MAELKAAIIARSHSLGFSTIGFTRAALTQHHRDALNNYLEKNHHGGMQWMQTRVPERADPQTLWPEAVSVISLGLSYAPDQKDALATTKIPNAGNISIYARGRDYHDIVKGKLKHLAQFIARQGAVKVFVDTAPVMEKPLAQQAGIGWQGKHTNLVSRAHGSWLFLGEIFTTLEIPADASHADNCGTCHACLTACPTNAFPAPYQLDARRCISYLTIEHAAPIPHELRAAMGNRIYGCDDCLAVCPWNKFAAAGSEAKLAHRADLIAPPLAELAQLTDESFRKKFSASPIKRIGRNRFIRNVAIAIGNSKSQSLIPAAQALANDTDPVIVEAASWALEELSL
jgi:epoxyqueuosine reductase